MSSRPLVPDGMVGAAKDGRYTPTEKEARPALGESPDSGVVAQTTGGGVGDSPVRGTLVERGERDLQGPVGRDDPRAVEGLVAGAQDARAAPTAGGEVGVGREGAGVCPVPGELARREPTGLRAKHAALIAKADDRIRRKATSIVDAALSAPELAELDPTAVAAALQAGGPPLPGWSKKKLRTALDATNSMKSAPAYLAMSQRVVESYKKAESDRPTAPQLNAEIVQVTINQQVNYPVRVLDEE